MSMKKATAIFLSVLILASVICNVFAADVSNRVYAENVTVEGGEQVTVPIKIENNEGFMGFSVTVSYDDDVFTPLSVSKGEMLTGMFNDSIETSTDNSFKVVFTGTEDIVSDGVMFNVVFEVADSASGAYELDISYVQQDTFKEGWENAVFNCENVEVVVTDNGTTAATEPSTQPEPGTTEPVSEPEEEPGTEPITNPSEEPSTEPITQPGGADSGKPLSVRLKEWVRSLPSFLSVILGVFVYPLAFIISVFE